MDVFIREHQMRMETWVLLSDSTAKDILTSTMEQEENSAIGLSKMIYSESRDYESLSMRLMDLTSRMMEETTSPVIPIVTVKNKNGNSEAEISGLAILKEDKYIGELDLEKVRGYSWIMGNCREISFNINIEDGYSDMSISNIKLKNKPKLGADGPFISIDFKGDVAIREIQGFEGMKTDEIFAILQKACVEQLEKEILDCFNYSKDLNADIYGFGTEFYRKHPKDFEKLKEYWDEIYPELDMELEINLEITDTGKVLNSLYMEEQSDENR
jgi:spore germination protein KC